MPTVRDRLLVELCAGTAVLSRTFRLGGWRAITVDIDPERRPNLVADVRKLQAAELGLAEPPDLVWMAPPCLEFARRRMPWLQHQNAGPPDMGLVEGCLRLRNALSPKLWALENVLGAVPFIEPLLGKHQTSAGGKSVFIWSNFELPPLPTHGNRKQNMSSRDKVRRASYPQAICTAIFAAAKRTLGDG